MKCGIALEAWKRPIFEKRLTAAGFKFENGGGPAASSTFLTAFLTVETDDVEKLHFELAECQRECAAAGFDQDMVQF